MLELSLLLYKVDRLGSSVGSLIAMTCMLWAWVVAFMPKVFLGRGGDMRPQGMESVSRVC